MSWENIIKRGKSFGRKKRAAEHNAPTLKQIEELEKDLEKHKVELSTLGTSQQIERYGFETQMNKVRKKEKVIRSLESEIKELKDKLM